MLSKKSKKNEEAKPVEVVLVAGTDGLLSYDVRVHCVKATVADYLAAMNAFQEERVAPCNGCTNCCWERVPLTAPDVYRYLEERQEGLAAFIRDNCQVTVEAGTADICLRRRADGSCLFLDRENHRCRRHSERSLVCQSYICLPATRRAQALRRQIVNEGENELVRLWNPSLVAEEPRGFFGKESYDRVGLLEVAGPGLWRRLGEPDGE